MEAAGGSIRAGHLCVLVHGLWGNPQHMGNIAKSLRDQYSTDELHLLLAKRNSGSFTYDGIERGGERVCAEIEEEIQSIKDRGGNVSKLSIIGYSLGGLVSRYAVGLLHAKGVLDKVECMNFATFASPHLGVRTPLKGWHNTVWNVVGARTLSMSGRQLFIIDNFRETRRPLLSVMADPSSIFMAGLRKFKRHTLYSNILNDRSAVYYTTCIQKTDPFTKLEDVKPNFIEGTENVLMDRDLPYTLKPKVKTRPTYTSISKACIQFIKNIPFMISVAVFVPIGLIAYLANSVVQNFRSANRIKLYEQGQMGISIAEYRFPLLIKDLRSEVENVYEALNSSQPNEFLGAEDESGDDVDMSAEDRTLLRRERRMSLPGQPTLALAPCQFEMIRSLDTLGWRKYPVWIHRVRHSHGAIIARIDKRQYDEGFIVMGHFAKQEFLI